MNSCKCRGVLKGLRRVFDHFLSVPLGTECGPSTIHTVCTPLTLPRVCQAMEISILRSPCCKPPFLLPALQWRSGDVRSSAMRCSEVR